LTKRTCYCYSSGQFGGWDSSKAQHSVVEKGKNTHIQHAQGKHENKPQKQSRHIKHYANCGPEDTLAGQPLTCDKPKQSQGTGGD
jgi:hypothetical protein